MNERFFTESEEKHNIEYSMINPELSDFNDSIDTMTCTVVTAATVDYIFFGKREFFKLCLHLSDGQQQLFNFILVMRWQLHETIGES